MGLKSISCALFHLWISISSGMALNGSPDSICPRLIRIKAPNPWSISEYGRPLFHGSKLAMVDRCCEGYQQNGTTCEPICEKDCVHGKCAGPNHCDCDPGYIPHIFTSQCVPWCKEICLYGSCIAPNTCSCSKGYVLQADNHTCEPHCSKPCDNGYCWKPDVCVCNPGYENQSDDFPCTPICTNLCQFGKCTGPEICTCNEGYKMTVSSHVCEPVCEPACQNAWCNEPNICKCYHGYIPKTANGTSECVPACERPCINGVCTTPNNCSCNEGFEVSEDDIFTCEPLCREECIFGDCTAPNTCTCNKGYEKTKTSNGACVPVCEEHCGYGDCIAPNECKCHEGFIVDAKTNKTCVACELDCVHGTCTTHGCVCSVGWGGSSCNTPIYCSVNISLDLIRQNEEISRIMSTYISSPDSLVYTNRNDLKWDAPSCHSECVPNITQSYIRSAYTGNHTISLLLAIDAPCNIQSKEPTSFGTFDSWIGPVVGGIVSLVVLIALTLTSILIHIRKKNNYNGEARQFLYTVCPDNHENDAS